MERTPPEGRRSSPEPAVSSVLGDDNLLGEILLRLDFPTCLVRAAVVSKRWLRRASDPAFLRGFRALHPPRILGIYVQAGSAPKRFLPVPQPQELAAAAGRALGNLPRPWLVGDCRNGRLLVRLEDRGFIWAVRSLLQPAPDEPLPTPPDLSLNSSMFHNPGVILQHLLLLEGEDDTTSCLCLLMAYNGVTFGANYSILQSGVWGDERSVATEIHGSLGTVFGQKLLLGTKVYMMTAARCILVLDLDTASFFKIELPHGVGGSGTAMLSRAQRSGLYLVDATGFHLRIWHGDGAGQWVLVDTISVREACGRLNVQRWETENGQAPAVVFAVGDNAEFVIFKLVASGIICCMQLAGNRVVEKVADGVLENYGALDCPIAMVWPPIFPVSDRESEED
ncbi:hypothetical protein ACP70R_022131 [Stipagrostis hirtigluma subsp. patula]